MQQEKKLLDMSGPSSGPHSNSRWNPTKEQINLLEGMYRQGIRTPSAEQIQQITNRLKAFGHIEGKNVFYWFQNHKARQRQKQKQETMVYLNPLLHKPAPIMMPSPCTNGGVYSPYCMPPPGMTFYAQYPKVLLPGSVRSRAKEHTTNKRMRDACGSTELVNPIRDANDATNHETLQLFPLHPTRILEGRSGSSPSSSSSSETYDLSPESTGVDQVAEYQPFFDFFSPHASCETADR